MELDGLAEVVVDMMKGNAAVLGEKEEI